MFYIYNKLKVLILACMVACAIAYPYPHPDEGYAPVPVYGQPAPAYGEPGPVGRVKMQVRTNIISSRTYM
jgi:hypothetical protein